MTDQRMKEIASQLEDHEKRIRVLERAEQSLPVGGSQGGVKQPELRDFVKGRKFKNGQEQLTAVVGYHEKILGKPILLREIKAEWINAKMTNIYNKIFISRAIKDRLIRRLPNGKCDLTQGGENFFASFLKDESVSQLPK